MKKWFEEWPEHVERFLREDRKEPLVATDMTRREFLRMGVGLVAVASGLQVFAGCATTDASKGQVMASPAVIKPKPVIYPPLPYNKVQPPKDGCLVGLYKMSAMPHYRMDQDKLRKIANRAHNLDE